MDSLSLYPNDPKALFRQVQAEEALEKIEDAAQNMAKLIQMDPRNKTFQQTMERLRERVYEKAKEQRDMNKQVRCGIGQSLVCTVGFLSTTELKFRRGL